MVLYIRMLPVVREVFLASGLRRKDGWRKVERRMEKGGKTVEKGGKTVEKAGMTNCEMKGNLVLKCGIYLS